MIWVLGVFVVGTGEELEEGFLSAQEEEEGG